MTNEGDRKCNLQILGTAHENECMKEGCMCVGGKTACTVDGRGSFTLSSTPSFYLSFNNLYGTGTSLLWNRCLLDSRNNDGVCFLNEIFAEISKRKTPSLWPGICLTRRHDCPWISSLYLTHRTNQSLVSLKECAQTEDRIQNSTF